MKRSIDISALRSAPSPQARLRMLRLAAGYESAKAAGIAIGIPFTTYQQHERGHRPLTRERAAEYARFFKVPAGLILYGDNSSYSEADVAVIGTLSAKSRVEKLAPGISVPPMVSAAPIQSARPLHAIAVIDNGRFPFYRAGDAIYFEPDAHPRA